MCRRPSPAVRTPPPSASEDAPRRVWTLPCESGNSSAGVDAPSPGENAPAISSSRPGGYALVRSQPALRQGPFCPCLLGVRAAGRPPGLTPFSCQMSGEPVWAWVGGCRAKVAPLRPRTVRFPTTRRASRCQIPVFSPPNSCKIRSCRVLSENRVFPPVSGLFTFLFLDFLVIFGCSGS